MPRKGRALEKLVAAIERATNNQPHVRIESPGWRIDKRLNRRREHDVLLTVQQAHHTITIAIECRDRGRRVGAPDVEGFQTKCRDTGVDRGIIVSSTGFRTTALIKAEAHNIECFSLEQAEALDWFLAPGLFVQNRTIEHVFLRAIPESQISDKAILFVDPDVVFTVAHASQLATKFLGQFDPLTFECDGDAVFPLRAVVNVSNLYAREPDGTKVTAPRVLLEIRVLVRKSVAPFDLRIYRDAARNRELLTTAVADIDLGPTGTGKIVVIRKEGEDTQISWVPDPKSGPAGTLPSKKAEAKK